MMIYYFHFENGRWDTKKNRRCPLRFSNQRCVNIADILILLQILSIIYQSFANHFSILSHSIILMI